MTARRFRATFAIGVAFCFFAAIPLGAQAAAGDLDPTFGTGGKVTTAIGAGDDRAYDIAVQTDGKILAAGGCLSDFCLVRYNSDGSLDTSFDTDGKVTTNVGASSLGFNRAVAVQSDGKIVAALGCQDTFCLGRYNSDGSLDTSFDTDGLVTTDVGTGRDITSEVLIQSDQKIVAVGYCRVDDDTKEFCLARYNSDGSLDTSFDGDGKVTNDFGFNYAAAEDAAIQATDGKIVAVGGCGIGETHDSCVARFNSNGSVDTSFDSDGLVIDGSGGFGSLAVQSDGKIVATAAAPVLVRYNSDGSLDTSFDTDGKATNPIVAGFSRSTAVQSDGKLVVSAACNPSLGFATVDFCLGRLNSNGSLDTSFDTDGLVTTSFGDSDVLSAVALQSDGKIVAAGGCNAAVFPIISFDFCLARYDAGGTGPVDGIDDTLQPPGTPAGSFVDDTGDGQTTTGMLTSGSVTVTDAADPEGVVITAGAAGATLTMCPPPSYTLLLFPNTSATVKCGSVTVKAVANGSVIVRIPGADVSVTFAPGSSGTVESDGGISVTGASGDVTMTVSGASGPVPAGDSTLLRRGIGNDLVNGTSGNDLIFDAGGNNTINGKGGRDTIVAGSGNDTINGDDGDDWIDAGDGNNTVKGGAGNDSITSGSGNDTIDGGSGYDSCNPSLGKNTVKNCEA